MSHSEKDIAEQENLTKKRFNQLVEPDDTRTNSDYASDRPQSFAALTQWASSYFAKNFGKSSVFIHNDINIDGAFLSFCENKKIKVKCLLNDGFTSWKTDFDTDSFVCAGVFLIKTVDIEFLHCSLFHKGNQYDDEVSFFNIVKHGDFDDYIKFKNEYKDWKQKRERDTLSIEVIGGDNIYFDRNLTWDDLFLPPDKKRQIVSTVEGFLNSEDLYRKMGIPWKTGMILFGERGCGKSMTLKIIMSVYRDLKPVTVQQGHSDIDELIREAFDFATENSPSLLYFEDLQEMIKSIDISNFLQLLDGVSGSDGVLTVATANAIRSMENNIISRPRRFDKKVFFDIPDSEMSSKYLKNLFKGVISKKEVDSLIEKIDDSRARLTYSHLQNIYISSVHAAIQDGRKKPNEKDIIFALNEVVEDSKDDYNVEVEEIADFTELGDE